MNAASETLGILSTDRRYFSLDEANRALGYVARVVRDLCQAYRDAVGLQQRLEFPMPTDRQDDLQKDYEAAVLRLNGYVDELREVGVELKDYESGLVDFPALHEGREVCLCWRLGEPEIKAWHETDAGFSGRRDVSELEG